MHKQRIKAPSFCLWGIRKIHERIINWKYEGVVYWQNNKKWPPLPISFIHLHMHICARHSTATYCYAAHIWIGMICLFNSFDIYFISLKLIKLTCESIYFVSMNNLRMILMIWRRHVKTLLNFPKGFKEQRKRNLTIFTTNDETFRHFLLWKLNILVVQSVFWFWKPIFSVKNNVFVSAETALKYRSNLHKTRNFVNNSILIKFQLNKWNKNRHHKNN